MHLAYDGSPYHGWQTQPNAHTVQQEIEEALAQILRRPCPIMGSGRTDTGVHALEQVAHFDVEEAIEEALLRKKLNGILPPAIAIHSIQEVQAEAHARFDAVDRSYCYQVRLRKDPFAPGRAWTLYQNPDLEKMNEAALFLLKQEDFQCFSKVHTDVRHFRCSLYEAYWEQEGDALRFHIRANRFLRGMVRAIVGTLVALGQGKVSLGQFQEILASGDRRMAGAAAPPYGLYLSSVRYPESVYKTKQ